MQDHTLGVGIEHIDGEIVVAFGDSSSTEEGRTFTVVICGLSRDRRLYGERDLRGRQQGRISVALCCLFIERVSFGHTLQRASNLCALKREGLGETVACARSNIRVALLVDEADHGILEFSLLLDS